MFNVVGKHLVQEEGGEWRAEETRGGWALPQKVEHPQLKFLVAPLPQTQGQVSAHGVVKGIFRMQKLGVCLPVVRHSVALYK